MWRIFYAVLCVNEITPDLFVVRRAVNILNKHTIRIDCSEPPGHLSFMVVFVLYARKTTQRKETNNEGSV